MAPIIYRKQHTGRRCPKCETTYGPGGFYRDASRKDGLAVWCKECVKAKARAWHSANPERASASSRKHYLANRKRYAEAHRRWVEANPEATREGKRRWAAKWREANPERHAARKRLDASRRRLRVASEGGREALDYATVLYRDPCAYCGAAGGTLDHIVPLSAGGDSGWDNLTAACLHCNSRKHATPLLGALLRIAA